MSNPDTDMCCRCRYWDGSKEGRKWPHSVDDCRRHAPILELIITTADAKFHRPPAFPQTTAIDWCGDFEPLTPGQRLS